MGGRRSCAVAWNVAAGRESMRRPMNRNGGASVLNQWASGTGSEWWVELSPSGRRALGVFYLKENAVVD